MALEWWSEQPFPPLTSKNYKEWSVQIKRFLIDLELWEAIDVGLEAMLEKAITEKAQREARARDKRALSILQRGVDDVNFNHLIGIKSARQAWEILRKAHQSSDIEISNVTDGADDDVMSLHRPVQKGATVVCESNGGDVKVVGSKSSFGRTNVHHSSGRSDASRLIKPVNGSIVEDAKASQFHWTLGHKVVNVVEVAKTEVKIEIDVEAKVEDATTEEFLVVQRKIEIAEKQKEEGNASFKAGEYAKASQRYEKGAKFIESVSDEEKSQSKVLKISCNLNNAACKLKLKDYEHAEKLCTKVLELDSRNVKALYRRAQAYTHLFNLELAEFDIKKALEIEPDNREVKLEYKTLKDKVKECNKKDAKFYSNIFSKLTKSESGEKEKVKEISKEAEKNEEVSEEKENPSSTASDNVYSHHSSIASDNVSNQVTLSTVLENPLHPKDLVSTQDGAEKVNSSDDKLVGAESVSPFDTSYVTHGGTNIVDDVTSISSSCADLDSTPRAVENLGKEVVGDDIGIIQNVSFEGNCVKELSHDVSGVPNKSLQADIDDDGVTREIAVAEKERASYKEVLAKNDELEEQLLRLKYGAVLRLEADLKRVMNSNEELKAELYEETAYGMGSFDREEIETFGDFCAMEEKLVRSMESEQVCSANSRPVVAPEPEVLTIPDPDLHEFDDGRKQECFSADQLCAMYDTLDEILVVSKEETISSEEAASEEGKPVYVTEEVDVTKPMVTPDSNEVRVVKSKTVAEDSPILEKLKKKGYEVALFVVDAIDQYASRRLKDCEDEKLVSATKDEKYVVSAENEKASLGYTVSAVSAETVIAKIVCKHIDDTQSVWELKADEARLDRKGLHSDQFYITTNGQVIMASEMELLDVPPEYVSRKESLDPGMTFLVDFEQHIVVNDEALKRLYGKWLKRHELKVDGIENGPALDAYYLKFIVCIPEEHEMHKSSPVSDGTVKVNNHDNEVKFPSEGIG